MDILPWTLCILLLFLVIFLTIKIFLIHRAADELRTEFESRLREDSNVGIDLSTSDRKMKQLAADLDRQLKLLRKEQLRYVRGDQELKTAITNISHDLRTPLTALCGYMELLSRELHSLELHSLKSDSMEPDAIESDFIEKCIAEESLGKESDLTAAAPDKESLRAAREYLTVMENRVKVLKELMEEFFRYSIIVSAEQYGEKEVLSLNSAIEEAVAGYYAALKNAGIEPEIHLPEKEVVRELNRKGFSRILSNIISNAIKYSDGDFKITLEEDGTISFWNHASGLDEVQAGHLLERFYTVETGRQATGLGLSIAKTLTEEAGGRISLEYQNGMLHMMLQF